MEELNEARVTAARDYFAAITGDATGSWRSWWHCHSAFLDFVDAGAPESGVDNMALNLGFYLASWGMYRGSSFLVHKDYTVHEGAARILASYSEDLRDLSFGDLGDDEKRGRVLELALGLKEYYDGIAGEVAQGAEAEAGLYGGATGKARTFHASYTLVTKVMLGTLACCPAYDRYFMAGEREIGMCWRGFGKRSLAGLGEACGRDAGLLAGFSSALDDAAGRDCPCPDMKALDFLLWHIGWRASAPGDGE